MPRLRASSSSRKPPPSTTRSTASRASARCPASPAPTWSTTTSPTTPRVPVRRHLRDSTAGARSAPGEFPRSEHDEPYPPRVHEVRHRRRHRRHRRHRGQPRGAGAGEGRRGRLELGQGRLPLLRHRLRHPGRDQGRAGGRGQGRPRRAGQPGPELHQGLLQRPHPLRPGPADPAADADEERRVRQEGRLRPGDLGAGDGGDGAPGEARAGAEGADRNRDDPLRPVADPGGLRRGEADEGGLPLEQHRSQRAAVHGQRRGRVLPDLRGRRAGQQLRRHRAGRRDDPLGRQHGRGASGALVADHRPQAHREGHQDRQHHDLREPVVGPRRPRDRDEAQRRPRDPELHRTRDHRAQRGQPRVRRPALRVRDRSGRHRLRDAADGQVRVRRREGRAGRGTRPHAGQVRGDRAAPPAGRESRAEEPRLVGPALADRLRRLQEGGGALHARLRRRARQGRPGRAAGQVQGQARRAGRHLHRPQAQRDVVLDDAASG